MVLDLRRLTLVTDYFVICSGDSVVHVRAIAEHVEEQLDAAGGRRLRREGGEEARWILLDYGGVVIHVFHHAEREFYKLERLWGDAPRVPVEPGSEAGAEEGAGGGALLPEEGALEAPATEPPRP